MLDYLQNHSLISEQQHTASCPKGNEPARITKWLDSALSFENTAYQTVAHVDFAKAFDSVCHSKLIAKLRQYSISGNLLQRISDFCQVVLIELLSDTAYQMWGIFLWNYSRQLLRPAPVSAVH